MIDYVRYRPLVWSLLVVVTAAIIVTLTEYWRSREELAEERLEVAMELREMRALVADYRLTLARAIPQAETGSLVARREELTASKRQIARDLSTRLQNDPLLLKHASRESFDELSTLLAEISKLQERSAGVDDEGFIALVKLLERDVELLDRVLIFESAYQRGIFSLDQLTEFIGQLRRSRVTDGRS